MALTHLIDTSVAARLANPAVRDRLVLPTANGRIGRTTVTDLEVGFSARNSREWEALTDALAIFAHVAILDDDLQQAGLVQRTLVAAGHRGRKIPDLIIAAAAQRLGLATLHYDGDFDLIADVTGQRCEWVVPRGSID